jgi:hypothetical protein
MARRAIRISGLNRNWMRGNSRILEGRRACECAIGRWMLRWLGSSLAAKECGAGLGARDTPIGRSGRAARYDAFSLLPFLECLLRIDVEIASDLYRAEKTDTCEVLLEFLDISSTGIEGECSLGGKTRVRVVGGGRNSRYRSQTWRF